MATWESKMPPFHETWSSSMKSADATDSQMPDSKLFLSAPAFNTRSASQQFSGPECGYHSEFSGGGAAAAAYNLSSVADKKPSDYGVTASTTVVTTSARGSSKSSGLLGVGGASAKATKKRARASRKPPTTVLEADSSNFRAMVQQLTGIPSLPFLPTAALQHQRPGLEFLDLVRPPSKSLLGFGAPSLQGLPPMDPSSMILNRGQQQQQLHNEAPGFTSQYLKYMSAAGQDHSRRPPSMGDFLRTPLDELGLDQNNTQQQQVLSSPDQQQQQEAKPRASAKLEPSMPLLWEGNENPRDMQLNDMSKYKSSRPEVGGDGAPEVPSNIVDSWLSQTDPGADNSNSRADNLL